jgi:hypothetical protein
VDFGRLGSWVCDSFSLKAYSYTSFVLAVFLGFPLNSDEISVALAKNSTLGHVHVCDQFP